METAQQLQPITDIMLNVDQNAEPNALDESQEGYNPFQIPANIAMAKKHGKAKRVYCDATKAHNAAKSESKYLHKNGEVEACKCCGNPVEGEMIPVTAPLRELYHLGSGYPLYFRFIKYSIAMLLAMLVVSGIYNLVTNVIQGDCISQDSTQESVYCLKGYILSFTLPNKRDDKDLLTAQLALNLATVIIIMIFFHYLRYQFRRTEIAADDATITPSDYTIEIENVDPNATNKEIKQWIIESFATPEQPLDIERIVRPYAINKYMETETKVSSLKTQKNAFFSSHHRHEPSAKEKIRMETIDAEIQFHEAHKEQLLKSIHKANLIFVTFRTAQQANDVVSKFKRPLLAELFGFFLDSLHKNAHSFKGNRVTVRRAPEPSDVLWSNLGYTKHERNRTRVFSNTITLLMIVISFGIIILVNWAQGKAVTKYGKDSSVVQGLSIVASLVIVATNSILALLIDFLANYEKHYTYTHYLRGVAQKLAIAQFLNTALTNLFAEFILSSSNSDEEKAENGFQNINIYGKGGLIENMYWVFITNAFLTPALAIFDPMYILKRVKQFFVERNETKGGQNKMTQRDAHILYEGPVLAMPTKYAGMIKMVLLATFYAPAIPFALIYTIPGLILWYWADKYVLLRRNAKPKSIDDDLADAMVEYLEWAACTFAAGNIMYTYTLKNSFNDLAFDNTCWALIWVTLGFSLFHIIFPMETLNRKLFHIEDKVTETLTFDEARLLFNPDYDIANPLTHAKALREYFKRLQSSKSLAQSAQVKKLIDKGIFGKLNADNFTALMSPQSQTPVQVEHTQVDQDEDEIDLNGLADYAKHVEQQKVMSTNNGNVEQGAPLGTFFNRVAQDQVNGGEALKNLFGKLPAEDEPLNGAETEKPRRQDSQHNDNQAVNDVVGNFFGGNMMNKEVYQDDEPIQNREGEDWNNLFTPNGAQINNINSFNNKLPEREKEVEDPNGRTLKSQDSANIQPIDANEDSNGVDRSQTVSRRIVPKSMDLFHQN